MPPKAEKDGKKKKKSKSKLTEDAKRYQMEQKAAIEEERRRLREELIQTFLQHKLEREQGLGRANQAKISEKWRQILRSARNEALREEIEDLREKYEFQISQRQARISELLNELATADKNQFEFSQGHIANIGSLIDCHKKTISQLRSDFDQKSSEQLNVFDEEFKNIKEKHNRATDKIKQTIKDEKAAFDELQTFVESEYELHKEELLDECLEREHSLTVGLESQIESSWKKIQQTLTDCYEANKEKIEVYEELSPKDEVLQREIQNSEEKINFLKDEISRLKEKIEQAKQGSSLSSMLRAEEEELRQALLDVRLKGKARQDEWSKAFLYLVKIVGGINQELDDIIKRGDLLLRTVSHEFPHPLNPIRRQVEDSSRSEKVDEVMKLLGFTPKAGICLDDLGSFWYEFNQIFLEKTALGAERRRLAAENEALQKELNRDLLAQTLTAGSCGLHDRCSQTSSEGTTTIQSLQTTTSLKSKIKVFVGAGQSAGSNYETSFDSEVVGSTISQ